MKKFREFVKEEAPVVTTSSVGSVSEPIVNKKKQKEYIKANTNGKR